VAAITLSRAQARRLAVSAQLLAGPRPRTVVEVAEGLGGLQLDPTSSVARSERLVLHSRLGAYDAAALDAALAARALHEYAAFIVPARDFAIHREAMRRFPRGDLTRAVYTRRWLAANAAFRRSILRRLRAEGPLPSRALTDEAAVPWRSGGWNDGKSLSRMLELLHRGGQIAIAGRAGAERLWDAPERVYPLDEPRLPASAIARRVIDGGLRRLGLARPAALGFGFDGRPPGSERALRGLLRDGVVVPVSVAGSRGPWLAHAELLDRPFAPRTALLSPFDRLIHDRVRTEDLFGFRYRLEIYVPPVAREYGYYVLPILHGDELVGRLDPTFDRRARRLDVRAVWAQPDAPAAAGPAIATAIRELASWLGAGSIAVGDELPRAWRADLRRAA
jgi:uncharacterized protein YcaQ